MWVLPQLAKEMVPSPTAEVLGQGGQPCTVTGSPLADIRHKAPVTSPELFFPSEKQPPEGKGEPGVIHATDSEATGGHAPRDGRRSQLHFALQPLCTIVLRQ